jgi:Fic family protein
MALEKPPNWREIFSKDGGGAALFEKALQSEELTSLIRHAQEKYVYWDIFKHYKFPKGFKAEEAWTFLKLSHRFNQEVTPIKAKEGQPFRFALTKTLYKRLNIIDTHTAGILRTFTQPSPVQKEQLIISGLSEEAIASSQIEGANTSRKVAKEMIYSGRKPRNKDEQMIINNYQVMQMIDGLKSLDLSEDMLLDIQKRITTGTFEVEEDGGRFRKDEDEIAVHDRISGEVVFVPPTESEMRAELKKLIAFANKDDEGEEDFLHPVIKATILHFWLAYLHPFVDGNGRTARAIFYWYLMKRGYWLFQYLSVSRVIKTSRKRYDNAFLHSEFDDNDLTYFLLYITEATCQAIEELTEYYGRKVKEAEEYKKIAQVYGDLNERQVALLRYFSNHPDQVTDIKTHQSKHGIVYETARRDMLGLVEKGTLAEVKRGYRKVFLPNMKAVKKLLKN